MEERRTLPEFLSWPLPAAGRGRGLGPAGAPAASLALRGSLGRGAQIRRLQPINFPSANAEIDRLAQRIRLPCPTMSQGSNLGMLSVDRSRRCAVPICGFHPQTGSVYCARHLSLQQGGGPSPAIPAGPSSGAAAVQAFLDQAPQPSKGLHLPNLAVANPGFSAFSGSSMKTFISGPASDIAEALPLVSNLFGGGSVAPFDLTDYSQSFESILTLSFDAPTIDPPIFDSSPPPVWSGLQIPLLQVLEFLACQASSPTSPPSASSSSSQVSTRSMIPLRGGRTTSPTTSSTSSTARSRSVGKLRRSDVHCPSF